MQKILPPNPRAGDIHFRRVFVWLPATLPLWRKDIQAPGAAQAWRWLETATVAYEYTLFENHKESYYAWSPVAWADLIYHPQWGK